MGMRLRHAQKLVKSGSSACYSSSPSRGRHLLNITMARAYMPGFLERVKECNLAVGSEHLFTPFRVADEVVGFAEKLLSFHAVFTEDTKGAERAVTLTPLLDTPEKRTSAVAGILEQLREQGGIRGWRGELYPVVGSFHSEPALLIERAAAPYFGIKAYGVHVNGYVETAEGLKLWVARRSKTKQTYPGKLDHIVAGGQVLPSSARLQYLYDGRMGFMTDCILPGLLSMVREFDGAVSYLTMNADGLKRDVLFCYDIKLPEDFVPKPQDGEVEEFFLKPIEWVMETVASSKEYKSNCCLVILDFLIRHGYIKPEEPGYLDLVRMLRTGDCS